MLPLYSRALVEHALTPPIDPELHGLLTAGLAHTDAKDLTDLTHYLVVEPDDTEADIVAEIGLSPLVNPFDGAHFPSRGFHPFWDALKQHDRWFELIICIGNGGFAVVLLIQDADGADPRLLQLCRTYAA